MGLPTQPAEIVALRDLGPDEREMTLRLLERPVAYAPGQWVAVHLPLEPKPLVRAYTLAEPMAPSGDRLVLCFDRVRGGAASTYLFSLGVGDRLTVADPQGTFVLPRPVPPSLLLVSWSTGVVPLRCMVLAARAEGTLPPTLLVGGARQESELVYRRGLADLEREVPDFRYLPVVAPTEAAAEAVIAALAEVLPAASPEGTEGPTVMICGLRAFVLPVRQWLEESRGVERQRMLKELYD